ncbi:MAG TPA: MarR family transcriptional regulator [Amycolatopsis sp.]|nr:MarR family transcriptional regulator [Amycolatopsis sp.]
MREEDVYLLQKQLKKLYRRLRQEEPVVDGLPLTALQILVAVERAGTEVRPGELAAELQMKSSNVAAALRSLEDQGLADRRTDPEDGRKAFVGLTERGRRLIADFRRTRHAWIQRAVDDLLTPDEQQLLLDAGNLMERLADTPD